jgi:methylmalonyl-CoA mutase N-terminal domain/subunit
MATEPRAMTQAERWYREKFAQTPERDALFTTISGEPVEPLYTPEDLPDPEQIGFPGEFPYTRGVYPSMYRGRLWTMRQFAGFGTAEETNERFRYLLDHGQTGLSTAFDMPSLMGHDSDHPRSLGEVGREGVAIDSLDDMEMLFRGIPMGEVSTSMTINAPAAIMLAFYVVAAENQGVPPEQLAGTIQTDILKEYIAQKEWCFPIDPAMRLVTDMVEFCARRMPRWHPISISGYHIREAGSTAQQELAFTLKDGFTYIEQALDRGLDVDDFAPRLSFFFNAHRLLRGDREVPRCAPHLGERAEEHLRREERALTADALPHPDGGRQPDRAAAAQQHRPHHGRGARRRARRHAVAAHQQLRRGARAPHAGGGADRAPYPADHRPRDRCDEHDRSAWGRLLR